MPRFYEKLARITSPWSSN